MLSWFWKNNKNATEASNSEVLPDSVIPINQEKTTGVERQALTAASVAPEPKPIKTSSTASAFSWFWRNKTSTNSHEPVSRSSGLNEELRDEEQTKNFMSNSLGDLTVPDKLKLEDDSFVPDPDVVEYFKDFPEYYREKAIRRYSSRRGLFRFDIIRNWKMQEEMQHAVRGEFMEAKREREALKQQHRQERLESYYEEMRSKRQEAMVPEWEKFFLQYFPLQDEDTMLKKLALAANLSACGLCGLHFGLTYRKRNPKKYLGVGKWRLVVSGLAGAAACVSFQYFAACRLYDWGYYDKTLDKRTVLDKFIDNNMKQLENGLEVFLDYIDPPPAKVKASTPGDDKS